MIKGVIEMEVIFHIVSFAVILFVYRKWDKESKEHEKYFLQQCKDVSEIKEELFLIHEHLGDLVDVTIAFDDLEDDNNAQTK